MKIRFGLQLDGQRGWHNRDSLGEITVGTNGMLGILEAQLGLVADLIPQARRIVQYLDCLKKADHARRFYHNSLETDELGTAATLLSWRDTWHLHGWSGQIESNEGRLTDMADVECLAKVCVSSSEGERLDAICQVMSRRTPAIRSVTLTTPMAHFPKRWQQVLSGLPVEYLPFVSKPGDLFLHALQNRLQRAQAGEIFAPEDKLIFNMDGSIRVVRAETRLLASRWLADRISAGVADGVLVASDALLDDILVSAGEARHGMSESSAFRPALQLLPMALALLWAPLDFNVLTSFLSHPISPVRGYARRKLAGKFADQPGIGGAEWDKALHDIAVHYGDAEVHEEITTWVDHPRFDRNAGVPLTEVMVRAQKLAHYFHVRLIDQDEAKRASWHAGFSQTSGFISAIEQLQQNGVTMIRQRQLQKLLTEATARGSSNPKLVAQTGAMGLANDPAALIESFEQVFWWQPVAGALVKSYPWSVAEIRALSISGVELPDISDLLERIALDSLRPVLAAEKQLVIVLPPREMEVHPAWQMIESLVTHIPEYSLEQSFKDTASELQSCCVVPHTSLPELRRWWQLPDNLTVPRMERESFSSLELFLFNPYQWLLRYPAGLKSSNILSVSDGFLLEGKLAHALIERLFVLPDSLLMTDGEISDWFDAEFPLIIETQGAVLLMDGRRADYQGLRYALRRALSRLLTQLKSADVSKVHAEMELNGIFPGGKILGYADLVISNQHGQQAIVDMKWGGVKKYSTRLAENTQLQLGIYAELLRQQSANWPDTGYFVLSEAKLLTQHNHYFPESTVIVNKTEESTPHLWTRFIESYAWRNELLKQGRLEVVLAASIPDEEFDTPEAGLKPEFLNPAYNDYLTLAGWRQS